jgi:hypothetical protein
MMQRLRDQTSSEDPVTARAAELLSAMPPLDTSKLRPRTLPRAVGRRLAGVRIRSVAAFAVTSVTVAAAAATMHAWPLSRAASGLWGTATEATSPISPPSFETSGSSGTARLVPPPSPVDVPRDVAPARSAVQGSSPPRATAKTPASSLQVSKAAPREMAVVEDESTLIVRAVRALRREGDPARAQTLAEQALVRFPHGAQVEEAMALVMESASARGDAGGAQRAASAYLDRFRYGRFADRAQRILASPAR